MQVTKVCVTELCGKTYLARVHLASYGKDAAIQEADIDARPSDAINMALRFRAPVYVNKEVVSSSFGQERKM
jgi:bifunctional DNase/RNase